MKTVTETQQNSWHDRQTSSANMVAVQVRHKVYQGLRTLVTSCERRLTIQYMNDVTYCSCLFQYKFLHLEMKSMIITVSMAISVRDGMSLCMFDSNWLGMNLCCLELVQTVYK